MKQLITLILLLLSFALMPVAAQQRGKASYYSKRATGARTASGVKLHNDSMVCAHLTYPFGTKLLVRNLLNGKEVVVKVVDRGPHARGRIIDLTYAAAEKLGFIRNGIAPVEVSVYHENKGIPFSVEPDGIPEFDFGISEPDSVPLWKKK